MMNAYFTVPNSNSSEVIIEDKYLRKVLIEAAMTAEKMLEAGTISIGQSLVSKPNKWGLVVETTIEQPKPNKPAIYKFKYRLDVVVYNSWLEEHSYMLGDEGALVFTSKKGIKVMVMPNEKKHPVAMIVIKYGTVSDEEHSAQLTLKALNFIVHREVINMHDWIVKYVVE